MATRIAIEIAVIIVVYLIGYRQGVTECNRRWQKIISDHIERGKNGNCN